MFRNYFIIAWRNLWKSKSFSLVNVMGLSIGMAAFLMILQYVNYQKSYDDFHPEKERLYRIVSDYYKHDKLHSSHSLSVGGVGTMIQTSLPEVEAIARINPFNGEGLVSKDSEKASNSLVAPAGTIYFADSTFFNVFDIPLILGNLVEVSNPDAAYISKSAADRLFDSQDPLNQWINIRNQGTNLSYFVAGVFENLPSNSHIQIDYLLPLSNQGDWFVDDFGWSEFYTYVKLFEDQDPGTVADQITKEVATRKKLDPLYDNTFSQIFLQPINKIHISAKYNNEPSETISPKILNLLIFGGLFILVIAYINYVNMSVSRSLSRAEEIGVRKVVGAGKPQLVGQFLLEALLVNLLAFSASMALATVLAPYFHNLVAAAIPPLFSNWYNLIFIVVTVLVGTFVSGFYPALVISSFNPSAALKGHLKGLSEGFGLRKVLTVVQFGTTLLLVIGSYSIYSQIQYMRNQNLGFEPEQTLVLNRPLATDSTYNSRLEDFGQTIMKESFVKNFTAATSIPGRTIGWYTDGVQRISEPDFTLSSRIQSVDYGYLSVFQLTLAAGRNFDEKLDANQNVMMINETAIGHFGFRSSQEAVGSQMTREGQGTYTVVGVIADYHHESLKRNYEPTVYFLNVRPPYFMAVKLLSVNSNNIATIQDRWEQYFGDNPFSYFYLDDYFNQQYQADIRLGKIIGMFALLAILIAGMGLLALSMALVQHRTKEIGVRKVLGASTAQILILLSSDLARLILIALVLATPLIYWGVKNWLNDFAFKMDITIWLFMLPGMLLVLVALMIVNVISAKAALANPVDSLKSE